MRRTCSRTCESIARRSIEYQKHTAELALLSSQIDKQELRQFYFSVVLRARFAGDYSCRCSRNRRANANGCRKKLKRSCRSTPTNSNATICQSAGKKINRTRGIWNGLVGPAARTPVLNLSRDTVRITRATTSSDDSTCPGIHSDRNSGDVSQVDSRGSDTTRTFNGATSADLPFGKNRTSRLRGSVRARLRSALRSEVDELVRVRLGIDVDLKITGQLFDRFEALDRKARCD